MISNRSKISISITAFLALVAGAGLSMPANANSYDSATNQILFVDKNEPANSYSATVTLGAPGGTPPLPSVTWNCNFQTQQPNQAVFTFQVGGTFSSAPAGSDNAGLSNSTATVSWQVGGTGPTVEVRVSAILGNYQNAKPAYFQFFVDDSNFIANYNPADSVLLSLDVNFNDSSAFRAAPDAGADQATFIDYEGASFSGLDFTSNLNKSGSQFCIDQASQQSQNQQSQNQQSQPAGQGGSRTLAKYSGPEFSALSSKLVTVGSSSVLEGKRLNEVSSITIGGKSATFSATSATELKLDVPTLAPGIYDLVIQSAAGKLTHMNAVRVQAPRRSLSITTVAEGRVTQNQFAEHALIASMQPRDLNRVRCIVNGPNLATARAQAEQLCAAVRGANRHIETSIVEPRSTVRDNKVYSRVTYGWN